MTKACLEEHDRDAHERSSTICPKCGKLFQTQDTYRNRNEKDNRNENEDENANRVEL